MFSKALASSPCASVVVSVKSSLLLLFFSECNLGDGRPKMAKPAVERHKRSARRIKRRIKFMSMSPIATCFCSVHQARCKIEGRYGSYEQPAAAAISVSNREDLLFLPSASVRCHLPLFVLV